MLLSLIDICTIFIRDNWPKDNIMSSNFLPLVSNDVIKSALASGDNDQLYEILVQPLHEELYRRSTFDFLDDLSDGQQLLLTYDYLRTQVGQGGFIQFIHNGYVGLLPSMIEQLFLVGAADMARVLDDVLKVYVLNLDLLNKAKSVQEFAQLYDELKEFEVIEIQYNAVKLDAIKKMLEYAAGHLDQFVKTSEPLKGNQ